MGYGFGYYCPEYMKIGHSNFHIIFSFTRIVCVCVLCFITFELVITNMFTFILHRCYEMYDWLQV